MCAVALDVGTMFLVKSGIDEIDGGVSFEIERNVFAEVNQSLEDPEEVLKDNNYAYVKHNDKFYVVGEDVFKVHEIESLFKKSGASSYFSEVRRPMKDGLLNIAEEKKSIAIIQAIIKNLVGTPSYENEVLCFCAPGDPINMDKNAQFHRSVLTNFISSLGYQAECINEALALIFSECPVMEDENEPDGVSKFSGLGFSFGAGMANCCLALRQLPLLAFSVAHSGDWIDEEASKVLGCDVSTITKYKEKHFDFTKQTDNLKHMALEVYYKATIENIVKQFASRFDSLEDDEKPSMPLEIVVGGGTASVPGFVDKFEELIRNIELPFKVKGVRLARNPLYAVSNGCLTKAISVENKLKKANEPKQKEKQEKPTQKIKLNKE